MDNDQLEVLLDIVDKETEAQGNDFFVGVGSLSNSYSVPDSFSDQLIENTEDLEIIIKNDLDKFEAEKIDVKDDITYEKLFKKGKKKAYDIFDFLSIKSKMMDSVPLSEDQLIITDDDKHVIEELKSLNRDYFAIYSMATLYAYLEMGIGTVKFLQSDGCALCKAVDGNMFSLDNAMNLVCSGNGVTHKYCNCEFFPVIAREHPYGLLEGSLNKNVSMEDGKELINVPVEMYDHLLPYLKETPNEIIEFLDIYEYLETNHIEADSGTLIYEDEEEILFVHNSYVGIYNPVDFVREFLKKSDVEGKIDKSSLKGKEMLYYKGKKVVEHDNRYWDVCTGEEVKNV